MQKKIRALQEAKWKLPEPFVSKYGEKQVRPMEGFIYVGPGDNYKAVVQPFSLCWGLQWWGAENRAKFVYESFKSLNKRLEFTASIFKPIDFGGKTIWLFRWISGKEIVEIGLEDLTQTIKTDFVDLSSSLHENEHLFTEASSSLGSSEARSKEESCYPTKEDIRQAVIGIWSKTGDRQISRKILCMGKSLIDSVNKFLRENKTAEALDAFMSEVKHPLAYMFTGKPDFVKNGVITFFSKLISIDNEFAVVMGPRRKTAEGKFEHPTYHIAFENNNGLFFAGFELKFVSNKYVKLVYRCPSEHYFEDKFRGLKWRFKHQSTGDYATVWIEQEIDEETYELLAQMAYRVKCHYLGINPSNLEDVIVDRGSSEGTEKDYLPTKADCEMTLRALRDSEREDSFNKTAVFDWLEKYFEDKGISMKNNWRLITERNLEIWFGEKV